MYELTSMNSCRKPKPVSIVVLVPPEAFGSSGRKLLFGRKLQYCYSGENRDIATRGENRDPEGNRSRLNCIKNCSLADHNFYLITNRK